MEADWDEVATIIVPPPGNSTLATPASVVAFDTSQELLWTGNDFGRVTSFYGPELQKYTSYRGHPAQEGAVKQFLFTDKGVLSISTRSVHYSSRRGLTLWHLNHEGFKDLRCMSYTAKGTHEVLVAGCQPTMFKIDVEKGVVTSTLAAAENYTMMKRAGQYICAATSHGSVHMIDPGNIKVVKTWKAHLGGISDMDAKADFLVTCGFSPRQAGRFMLDPLANVFDLKTLVPLPPIPFHTGAAYVCMHPRMSTTSIVASSNGQLQVVDIMNPNTANLRQVNLYDGYLTSLVISPSGEALAITDTLCTIRLWGSPAKIHFTEYSNPTEFPDHSVPPATMDWSPDTPLSTVGMPYYRETLLSAWPTHLVFEVGAPPPKPDQALMSTRGFVPNPKKTRRNQIEDTRAAYRAAESLTAPKFLSEKARAAANSHVDPSSLHDEGFEAIADAHLYHITRKEVPAMYGNVEIKYSKFGVDDFDFAYYNKTQYSGLETHIANSYANPLLQLYKFTPLIRNLALHHTATSCLFESCLLCELGFLIDMLEKANGLNCQATNFLKTFSNLSIASSLGLIEENSPNSALAIMIQSLNRFLLEKLSGDYRQMQPQQATMDEIFTTQAMNNIRCAQCNNQTARTGQTYVHDLVYPLKVTTPFGGGYTPALTFQNSMKNPGRGQTQRPSFSQVLKQSVERQESTRGWCDRCRRYQQLATRKTIQRVPPVLMINTALHTHEAKQLWSMPNWLPQEIGIIVDKGQFYCYEGKDLEFHLSRPNASYNIIVYELVGVVADINSGERQKSHLVSMINVGPSSKDPKAESQWYLFNDFLVRPVPKEEALRFDPTWKLPSVLTYQAKTASHIIDDSWKEHLDPSLLYRPWSANQETDPSKFRLLQPGVEEPRPGFLVGIDAEFVSLQQEEIEIKADGTRETIRPARLGLARVSVLRGSGPDEGIPFIDDYISVSEPIVDYLTSFSGISPGDLDRNTSPHALVSLKVAYKKLWLLLNLGVIFVGHGLPKDFRTINIHVPKKQVIDTVDLFFIPSRARKLSLRFLAWYLLKEDIQQETHDSIEDARTALRLWRKYEEFVDAGVIEQILERIYAEGRAVGYKAPSARPATADGAGGAKLSEFGTPPSSSTTGMGTGLPGGGGSAVGTPGRETPTPVRFGGYPGRGGGGSSMFGSPGGR